MLRITGYKEYTTREGDTFDALALSMYNDEGMSSVIIQFNPDYCDVIVFDAFVKLRLPVVDNTETAASLAPWRREET